MKIKMKLGVSFRVEENIYNLHRPALMQTQRGWKRIKRVWRVGRTDSQSGAPTVFEDMTETQIKELAKKASPVLTVSRFERAKINFGKRMETIFRRPALLQHRFANVR